MTVEEFYQDLREEKIIAIVRGVSASTILSIAEALYAGGIRLMEVTCNTPGVTDMLREVTAAMGDRMVVGAGTVISRQLAEAVHAAGARYIVAPDVNPEVIGYCVDHGLPVIPGAATATEILTAQRLGAPTVKIFPAEPLGCGYIKQLRGPINDMDFVAVGGVTAENVADFLKAGCVGAGLGGALVNPKLVEQGDWEGLTALAARVKAQVG